MKDEKGNKLLNYKGNWRDIFQNWEALSSSIPYFGTNVISKTGHATTADATTLPNCQQGSTGSAPSLKTPGRTLVTGPMPLIYLLKLIEQSVAQPVALKSMMFSDAFAYANVPYRTLSRTLNILSDPYDTIEFMRIWIALSMAVLSRWGRMGV